MKLLYQILEISEDADQDQIKKSYRRLALKWHPDKNLDNADECTEIFKELQKAYNVLGDPIKRVIYDDGEEDLVIINNYDTMENDWEQYKPTINHYSRNNRRFNYPQKFDPHKPFKYVMKITWEDFSNTEWFNGYTDKLDGFYTMCRKLFEILSVEAAGDPKDIKPFGSCNSDYKTVVEPFYKYWHSFKAKPNLLDPCSVQYYRTFEIRDLVKFIRSIDERIERYAEIEFNETPQMCSGCALKAKKENRKASRSSKSSKSRLELHKKYYNDSSNAIFQEIDGDFGAIDDEFEENEEDYDNEWD